MPRHRSAVAPFGSGSKLSRAAKPIPVSAMFKKLKSETPTPFKSLLHVFLTFNPRVMRKNSVASAFAGFPAAPRFI
jgi:hypothetical protein